MWTKKPALVPLRVVPEWVTGLKGLTLPDIVAAVVDHSGHILLQRREALLFAHFGLTGPVVPSYSYGNYPRKSCWSMTVRIRATFARASNIPIIAGWLIRVGTSGERLPSSTNGAARRDFI